MIGRLTGVLAEASFTEAIVDVNGVGYLVFIPMSTFDKLPKVGEKVTLMTHLNVREDALDLYGFASPEEKDLFALLRTVSGVGPKVALNILSAMTVDNFCSAVVNADVKVISSLKGLGKKTAERLVLELKGKIGSVSPEAELGGAAKPDSKVAKAIEEATLALVQLGFKYESASTSVHGIAKELPDKECSTENLIKQAISSANS